MTSQARRPQIRLDHNAPPCTRYPLQWPDSAAANLLIAGTMGFLYTILVLGLPRLDPTNLSWLDGDSATFYIGWELFRQDPHFHWPLTYTDRLGYPIGDSIAFMDPIPLLSILLKPFSSILPKAFQYLGIAAALAASLQFYFAARLFQMLVGRQMVSVLLPSLFFLMAPPMTWRFVGHYALANHWLLIAALCLFVSLQKADGDNMRKLVLWCWLLGGCAIAINPYLTFMVLVVLSASLVTACWRHRLSLKSAIGIFAATGVACLISALAVGLLRRDGGYGGGGYREYSMNLLAPIDPGKFGALFLRSMQLFNPAQYEGYNYLGAGVLMLIVMLLPSFSPRRLRRFRAAEVVPLALACLVLTALALSTKVSAGSVLIADLDPHEILTKYLAVFRSSGRLFWVPYYIILTAILTTAVALWRPRKAAVLITLALLVQFADTVPLRRAIRQQVSRPHSSPLRSPQWSSLSKDHANLLVLPPWQCGVMRGDYTPGGLEDGFRIFGLLAVSQHMRTNSYYAARSSPASLNFHCVQAVTDLMKEPLSPDSAYVVSPSVAAIIEAGPTGPTACHTLDGFILCSVKTDFSLGPGSPPEVPMMFASGLIESWLEAEASGYFIGDWYAAEPTGIWSKGHGIVQFRVSPEQRSQYHAVSLQLVVPVGANGVQYSIRSGQQEQSGTFLGAALPRVETFEMRVPLQDSSDSIERIVLTTQDAVRPIDIGMNNDTRVLGLGILGMTLIP